MYKINYPNSSIKIPSGLNIEGNKVLLLNYHESHDKAVQKMLSCPETMKYLKFMSKQPEGWSLEDAKNRRIARTKSQNDGLIVNFTIAIKKSMLDKNNISTFDDKEFLDPVSLQAKYNNLCPEFDLGTEKYIIAGVTGLQHIDLSSARAEIGIILDHRAWRSGFATEALLRVMKYSFEVLNLHRVEFWTTEANESMRGWLENVCKQQPESIFKDFLFSEGVYMDSYNYAFFELDWYDRLSKLL
ncbi:hypothetical protein BB561_003625 [Smittium simulii]|uniref:N-acetyltransferase domain-containing protein n=1 Tax=Smittium simulii TaxID=133385 RepID=A0A2T9YKE4_9FUNG|nr:hypothetical protein BB561_003625 [Smittium simulii]